MSRSPPRSRLPAVPGPLPSLGVIVLAVANVWAVAMILLGGGGSDGITALRVALALAYVAALLAAVLKAPTMTRVGTAVALVVLVLGWYSTIQPSHDRNWSEDQSRLPHPQIHGDMLQIANIRDFRYRSESDWDATWKDETFDLSKLERGWYIVEHFSKFKGAAHAMATFEFADGRFLAVSVEIRKEQGESYSPVRGLFRQYEIMYVIADERDALQLRTEYRKDSDVYLYEVAAGPENTRAFLEDMMLRASEVAAEPAFYNSLVDTCASNLARHLRRVSADDVSALNPRVLLPGYSHQLAYDLDLLGDGPLEQLKAAARTRGRGPNENAAASAAEGKNAYSQWIRER